MDQPRQCCDAEPYGGEAREFEQRYPNPPRRLPERRAGIFLPSLPTLGLLLLAAMLVGALLPLGASALLSTTNKANGAEPSEAAAKALAGDAERQSPVLRDASEQAATDPAASESAEPSAPGAPASGESWQLALVNPWHSLPDGYDPPLTTLDNGLQVDSRCYPDLQAMMDACRAKGLSPLICSAYRTCEYQEGLFQAEVDKQRGLGYSPDEARAEAAKAVAVPDTSEHQLGLAMDIVDAGNQLLDESQERTPVQRWLMEHSWEYGFVLRFPPEKSDATGIVYEPWHYRYVGKEAAREMHDRGVCLEEYLGKSSASH